MRCPHVKVTCSLCGEDVRGELSMHLRDPLHVPLLAQELLETKKQLLRAFDAISDLNQQIALLLRRIPPQHSLYVELAPQQIEDDHLIDRYSPQTEVLGHSWRLNVERKGPRGSPLRTFLFRDCPHPNSHQLIVRVHLLLNGVRVWSSGHLQVRCIDNKGVPLSPVPVDFLASLDPGVAERRLVIAVHLQWNRKLD